VTGTPSPGGEARLGRRVVTGLFFFSWRTLPRVLSAIKGVVDGVLLGASDQALLHAVDERYYAGQDQYADEDYNARGLHDWERLLLDRHFPATGHLAVTAAGGGREVLALLESGYSVTAYECNERLRTAANVFLAGRGHGRDAVRAAPRDAWVSDGRIYDGVVVGWGSYMLIPSRRARIDFLRGAASQLAEGGPILLSFYDRRGSTPYLTTVCAVGNVIRKARGAEPLTVGDAVSPNCVHYFDESQIRAELAEAGFLLAEYQEGDYGRAVGRAQNRAADHRGTDVAEGGAFYSSNVRDRRSGE
jgi:hypothetical protein